MTNTLDALVFGLLRAPWTGIEREAADAIAALRSENATLRDALESVSDADTLGQACDIAFHAIAAMKGGA